MPAPFIRFDCYEKWNTKIGLKNHVILDGISDSTSTRILLTARVGLMLYEGVAMLHILRLEFR